MIPPELFLHLSPSCMQQQQPFLSPNHSLIRLVFAPWIRRRLYVKLRSLWCVTDRPSRPERGAHVWGQRAFVHMPSHILPGQWQIPASQRRLASPCHLDGPECPRPNIQRRSLCLVGIWRGENPEWMNDLKLIYRNWATATSVYKYLQNTIIWQ